MPTHPANVWRQLPPQLQAQLRADLSAIFQEVIHGYLRSRDISAPGAQSDHLHSPIDPQQGIVTLTLGGSSPLTKREHQAILGPLRPLYAAVWIPVTSFQT